MKKSNYAAFLAGRADLNRCTRKRGPKPLKKARGAANLQSSRNNLDFSRMRNEIRMRSLVPRECNKQAKYMIAWRCRISLLMFAALTREILLSCDLCDHLIILLKPEEAISTAFELLPYTSLREAEGAILRCLQTSSTDYPEILPKESK